MKELILSSYVLFSTLSLLSCNINQNRNSYDNNKSGKFHDDNQERVYSELEIEESYAIDEFNEDRYDVFSEFPSGNDSLLSFIKENLKIPLDFKDKQGKVFLKFKITNTGKVVNPIITKSLTPSTDKEAIRIIKMLPDFIPAQRDGKFVDSYYVLFVPFDNNDEK